MRKIKKRPTTQFMKRIYKKKDLLIVEIGTWKGSNAMGMLDILPIKKIYLVDPYIHYDNYNDYTENDMEDTYNKVVEKFKTFGDKVEIIRKTSKDAISLIPDNLDFVYIDGNHDYEYIKEDIHMYYPKLKKGGILGGHDYDYIKWPGVTKAVNEFVEKNNLKLMIYEESVDSNGLIVHDWWLVKK